MIAALGCAGAPASRPAATTAWTPASREAALSATAAAVWSRRLPDAHRALLAIADRERGLPDPALDYWSEVVALLRCEPVARPPGARRGALGPWDHLRRLAQIERLRLAADANANGRRVDVDAAPDRLRSLTWPVEAERWDDEAPLARATQDHCTGEKARAPLPPSVLVVTAGRPAAAGAPSPRGLERVLVAELARALPPEHPARPAILFQQAVLAVDAGDAKQALDALGRLSPEAAARAFSAEEQATVALTWAVAADDFARRQPEARQEAVTRLGAALGHEWPQPVRRGLVFRMAEQLRAAGRVDEAVVTLGPPPHGDDALGRYVAFIQVQAHVQARRRGEALAEARAALGRMNRQAVDADPALSAIDELATRLLVASPLSPETMEVLESLGAPSERLGRIERFAQLAGAANAHASSMGAFLWLAENDPDPARRLHHVARASVAAARAGDAKQFARTFALLAGQEEDNPSDPLQAVLGARGAPRPDRPAPAAAEKPDAKQPDVKKPPATLPAAAGMIASAEGDRLYRSRRRELSLSWQRAMLVVARDALPSLVDNDDQANLKVLVERLQKHLTTHGRGPVDAELTTIYRAASAHLRQGARGYAERVGGGKRPIILGDVAVERGLMVRVPSVTIQPRGPRTLLWVPRVGTDPSPAALARWEGPLGVSLAEVTP